MFAAFNEMLAKSQTISFKAIPDAAIGKSVHCVTHCGHVG
jgi:hypothetical protein